jgi:hypothetical protein
MMDAQLDAVYIPSDDVVAREIEGEFIIVPLAAGIGDMEDELYSLNESGLAIWKCLDGKKSLKEISTDLAGDYTASLDEIEQDILGLVSELLRRKILVEVKST